MRCGSSPRHRARALLACAAVLLTPLVPAPPPAAGVATEPPLVRLAADPGSVVRAAEVAVPGGTTRLATTAYSLVAATWRGPDPVVRVRTTGTGPWLRLPELADGPSVDAGEGDPALRATELVWVGESRDIEVRVTGTGHRDLELVLIDPGSLASDEVSATASPTPARRAAGDADRAPRPDLGTRRDWDADPTWRNGRPHYNDRLQQVHVHHTANANDYSRTDVPGLLRGMYRYHTQTLGWFDLGYNFLVDRFGRAWIGRSGGAHRLVRGAHTLGFNTTSVGIAVIGTFEKRRPSKEVLRTVSRLAAWKLDQHGRDATGKVRVRSTGSDQYAEGERVRLPVIDGHRDTNDTACPGQRLYDRLPRIRRMTQQRIDRFDPES